MSTCDEDIRFLLKNLPLGLEETYRQCLLRIEHHENQHCREIAAKAFQWIAQARSPLSSRQLREVVCMTPKNMALCESDILNTCVTEYCANLITVNVMNQIQFVHPSVKQYLEKLESCKDELTIYSLKPAADDAECGKLCLGYLTMLQLRKQVAVPQRTELPVSLDTDLFTAVSSSSFLRSLSKFIGRKQKSVPRKVALPIIFRPAAKIGSLEIHDYILANWLEHIRNFAHKEAFEWLKPICQSRDAEIWPWATNESGTTAFYSYMLDHAISLDHELLYTHVFDCVKNLNSSVAEAVLDGPRFDKAFYPIHIAAARGSTKAVKMLIGQGCSVDVYDSKGKSPLCLAVESGSFSSVMSILLESNLTIQVCRLPDVCFWATLAELPDPALCVQLLAEFHFGNPLPDLFSNPTSWSQTMYVACQRCHNDIVNFLIDVEVDLSYLHPFKLNGQEFSGSFIVQAIDEADFEMAKFLLLKGAEIERDDLSSMIRALLPDFSSPKMLTVLELLRIPKFQQMMQQLGSQVIDMLLVCTLRCPRAKTVAWRGILRSVVQLHFQCLLWRDPNEGQLHSAADHEIHDFVMDILNEIPDDILALLFEIANMFPGQQSLQSDNSVNCIIATRRSPRTLLALHSHKNLTLLRGFLLDHNCFGQENRPKQILSAIAQIDAYKRLFYRARSLDEIISEDVFLSTTLEDELETRGIQVLLFKVIPKRTVCLCAWEGMKLVRDIDSGLLTWYITDPLPGTLIRSIKDFSVAIESLKMGLRRLIRPSVIFNQLIRAKSDGVFMPNFPAGYWKVGERWCIKLSIVGAFYRWNWRLRRKKGLTLSAADVAYLKAVPEILEGLDIANIQGVDADSDGSNAA